jgi:energy-coupling factor transporter ATP-binding protein EcfA2
VPAFSQRCPDDLHQALRSWLADRPWLSQNDLVNGAIAAMIGFPNHRVDTAPPTLSDYLRTGAIDEATYHSLRSAVEHGQCIAVFGPRQSGRTALLRALVHEYQALTGSPRRAMVVTTVPGELRKETPLLSMTLNDRMRERPLPVPDFIEPVFADDLSSEAMRGAISAWSRHGGAFTRRGEDIGDLPSDLRIVVAVSVLMQDGKVVMMIDTLPHENTREKMDARAAEQAR